MIPAGAAQSLTVSSDTPSPAAAATLRVALQSRSVPQ
jgi:hypothetical protein